MSIKSTLLKIIPMRRAGIYSGKSDSRYFLEKNLLLLTSESIARRGGLASTRM